MTERPVRIVREVLNELNDPELDRRMHHNHLAVMVVKRLRAAGIRITDRAGGFTPCTPRHRHCSPAHAELVEQYRAFRREEDLRIERETGHYGGDLQLWRENGGSRTQFGQWLKARKG